MSNYFLSHEGHMVNKWKISVNKCCEVWKINVIFLCYNWPNFNLLS